ncbi:hypothetical protein GLYMA_05G208200v4 [Glycine max]|uniref:BLOC-1-related complex subunit 6 C-terminal helix domain-containing protein n=2 Tax=Glycine subgen. Soja TaxID=1462606 RepID=A0A0R0K3S9_SOYBN|nr:uncharacterized protein LOC100305606 isoform X1 [Glycine max]XP_006579347.1 uncharacterized protein LOC100305606 isoform X1 [Glycine max]XP_006579348.1 uncharacterized protein LOC100305606 isoform X1 [Glycine max]XP_028233551.1 uncharacterized protein LOC114413381 isoform X1 [Glycine soja]XP_028233553.1 uncharacterized protein LOC114413381 isoform X1 [Glycine soja]XP_028233554.1 uncharacterized protein LOC114413381 isoform X1 [Glycine soja]XP_040871100.1 uncharacterized protein LOC10030560|eukprot:XP_006579346.1 uncharacterized protein LOC100305606 isoform X1 [Glycine max]
MGDREEQGEGAGSSLELEAPIPETQKEIPISDGIAFNNQSAIFQAIEVVERDSLAIAQSFTSLFASLRLALSESTSTSLHHMQCFTDATGRLQESVLDAATKGNRYINSCLRLNEEMKSVDGLASQLREGWGGILHRSQQEPRSMQVMKNLKKACRCSGRSC